MRAVDGPIFDIWNAGGPFAGPHRAAHGRVTVELGWTLKTSSGTVGSIDPLKLPIRWYTSTTGHVEKELPNVKMIETQRSIDTDAASCTVTIYNQQMSPSQDLELGNPGYFTFNRGAAGNRWSHAANDWSELLVPNALIRTYQGYGGHGLTIEDAVAAGNLVLTGVWLVDEVRITTQGTIELHMRDPVKLLMEQYCYIPLIPSTYYPLHYARFYDRRIVNPYVAYGATAGHKKEIVGIEPGVTDSRGNMGYWLVGDDGGVFTFGINYFEGGLDGSLTHTGIGIARNMTADGYWLAQKNGTVSNFGGAANLGSAADRPSDFVAIESRRNDNGYYLLDAAGEVYSFGDVVYFGNAPFGGTYVAMAVHPNGNGYWILDSTGHVFTFGPDMDYYGNAPSAGRPFVGMCSTISGHGYWIVDDVGHVYAFGDAFYAGGTQDITLNDPITDIIEAPNGKGYWLAAQDGGVFTFGDIPFYGSLPAPNTTVFPFDGNFKDYSDVVKDLLLWAGFWLYPEVDESNLPAVYGNIESTGAYPSGDPLGALPDDMFDKRPVLDAITQLKETVGYCVDEQTEILTTRGWLRWNEVKIGDETLAIDPVTGRSEWKPITHLYSSMEDGLMWSMEGRNHSSLTTGNHKWLVADAARPHVRRFRESSDLRRHDCIPVRADHECPLTSTIKDEMVELIAWFWTEGCYTNRSIHIAQSESANPENRSLIERALCSLYGEPGPISRGQGRTHSYSSVEKARQLRQEGWTYASIGRELSVHPQVAWGWCNKSRSVWALWSKDKNGYRLSQTLKAEFDKWAPNKVPTMEFLRLLTQEQLDRFIEMSCRADGHRNGDSWVMNQKIGERLDAFQAACVLAGYAVSIVPCKSVDRMDMATMTLGRRTHVQPIGAAKNGTTQAGWVPYNGMIWCPTVADHHTWLARRNGHVFFTGNCLWCDEEGAIHFESPNFWGPGNFLPDGGHVAFWPIIDERVDLITYGVSFNDKSVRSQIIISSDQPTANLAGTVTTTFTPVNADVLKGIVKPYMWVNKTFTSAHDQLVMAELLGLQIWFLQRLGSVECAANPMIQINDQVRIYERQTEEHYVHYVRTLETSHDLDTGEFRMNLTTHWMGDTDNWAIVRPG